MGSLTSYFFRFSFPDWTPPPILRFRRPPVFQKRRRGPGHDKIYFFRASFAAGMREKICKKAFKYRVFIDSGGCGVAGAGMRRNKKTKKRCVRSEGLIICTNFCGTAGLLQITGSGRPEAKNKNFR
jgi:hypothetical protein